MVLERVIRLVGGLIVAIAVARHLGPSEFGRLAYATAFQSIFLIIACLGLNDVLARKITNDRTVNSLAAAWRLRVFGAFFAFFSTLLVAWLWRPGDFPTWCIVALASAGLLFSPWDVIPVWYQIEERMGPPTIARILAFLGAIAMRFAFIAINASLAAFAVAISAEALIRATLFVWFFRRESGNWHCGFVTKRQMVELIGQSAPLMFSGLLVILSMQADRLLLLRWCGEVEAGVFVAGARLTEALYALPVILNTVLMPRLLAKYADNENTYWRFARAVAGGLVGVSVTVAFVLAVVATKFVPVLFGSEYNAAGGIFAIHVWSFVFVGIVSMRSRLLVVSDTTRWILVMSLLTTLMSLIGNAWMIPRYGALGAAWTSTLAWGFSALVLPWLFAVPRKLTCRWIGLVSEKPY